MSAEDIKKIQENVLENLSDKAKELMKSETSITTFFDDSSNDVFFGSDINKPRFEQIVEFLCEGTTDEEVTVNKFFGTGNTNQNTTPMTLKQMFRNSCVF